MKQTLASALPALTVHGFGTVAFADDAMMAKPDKTTMGTLVCGPAKTGETPTAMLAAKADLVCKPLDTKAIMAMEKPIESMTNGTDMWLQLLTDMSVGVHDSR
jgi:hypothetical protein